MHRCQLFCRNQGIYLDEYMQVGWHWLFHDQGACRIKAGLLIYSGNQWSGFNMIGTSVMKESRCTSPIIHRKSVLTCCKAEFAFLFCFFSIWLFFHKYSRLTGQQVKEKAVSWYPFYHFHPLHRQLDIIRVIAAESSPLRTAGSPTWTENLWYTLFRIHCFYTCTCSCCC